MNNHNYSEKIKRNLIQDRRERFSIRKLTVGAASVLLGFTFAGISSQTVKADTAEQPSQVNEKAAASTDNAATKQPDLTTYKGLSSFLNNNEKTTETDQKPTKVQASEKEHAEGVVNSQTAPSNHDVTSNTAVNTANATQDADGNSQQNMSKPTTQVNIASVRPSNGNFSTTSDSTVYVANSGDFINAMSNGAVHHIVVINDFALDGGDTYVPQRKVLVESGKAPNDPGAATRHIIDFRNLDFRQSGGTDGSLDITYRNLDLYQISYFGLFNTADANKGYAKITLDNINYTGSQMLYTGKYTLCYLKGKINAKSVTSYKSPIDNKTYNTQDVGQQLFELKDQGNVVTFESGCNFTGSTSTGNVIEMHGGTNSISSVKANGQTLQLSDKTVVNVESGANVTLKPRGEAPINSSGNVITNNPQDTRKLAAINIYDGVSDVNVAKNAVLNIDMPEPNDKYNDGGKAAAIVLTSNVASINDSGTISINANRGISNLDDGHWDSSAGILVYDSGNLFVNHNGALNIIGTNMGTYSGTLLYIGGQAALTGGALDIELLNDPDHPNDSNLGAGSGKIKLVDAVSASAIRVDNPRKLVLNASLNTGNGTSIIGNNEIDITNVRQLLTLPGIDPIILPPFHTLRVKGDGSGKINVVNNDSDHPGIEVLDGTKKLTAGDIQQIQTNIQANLSNDPNIINILARVFGADSSADLSNALSSCIGETIDQFFMDIIERTFSKPDNPGYNNITMIPSNQHGYLNIVDDNGIPGQASWHQSQKDGSVTITGRVINYDAATDGPEQPGNIFNKVMRLGTKAYVIVKIGNNASETPVYVDANHKIDDPYQLTNNVEQDLPNQYTVETNDDGVFSLRIPEGTPQVSSGTSIYLIPEANFVSFDPGQEDQIAVVQLGSIANLNQIKNQVIETLTDYLNAEKSRIRNSGLTDDLQSNFFGNVDYAYRVGKNKIAQATTFNQVNSILNYTINLYNHEGAKSEFLAYEQDCKTKANMLSEVNDTDAITSGNSTIDSVFGKVQLERKNDDSATNQARNMVEVIILNLYKARLNKELAEKKKNICRDFENQTGWTRDQISSLQDQAAFLLAGVQGDVSGALDINSAVADYISALKQLTDFGNNAFAVINKNQAILSMKADYMTFRSKLQELVKLTELRRNQYRAKINELFAEYSTKLVNCADENNSTVCQQFIDNCNEILTAAKTENGQAN